MKHNYWAKLGDIEIRQLDVTDLELLRKWRNDEETTKFLRKIDYITEDMQKNWFNSYLENEDELFFAIRDTNTLNRTVGSLALYEWNKEDKTCEIGKIQIGDVEAHGKGIGRKTLVMAMKIAFRAIGINKILASVHPDNVQAYHNDMKIGFRVIGETDSVVGGKELLLEMLEEDVKRANEYYDEIEIGER